MRYLWAGYVHPTLMPHGYGENLPSFLQNSKFGKKRGKFDQNLPKGHEITGQSHAQTLSKRIIKFISIFVIFPNFVSFLAT